MSGSYQFRDFTNGFEISGENRRTVNVELEKTGFILKEVGDIQKYGLYDYYRLSHGIAANLMADWQPPEGRGFIGHNGQRYAPRYISEWVITQTAGAIGKRVHRRWGELLAKVDPTVKAVQKAFFAATMTCPEIAHWEGLYSEPWVVSDILNYRGAAAAAADIKGLADESIRNRLENSSEAQAFRALAYKMGVDASIKLSNPSLTGETALELLRDWRGLYSPTGESYRSLDRTLSNLPGGIPFYKLRALRNVMLNRPVTDRVELLFVLEYSMAAEGKRNDFLNPDYETEWIDKTPLVLNARREQIVRALQRVSAFTHNILSIRRPKDMSFLVNFLADYPDPHNGSVVGLADKSIIWHRDRQEAEIEKQVRTLGAETPTALPPINLPDIPGITFLDKVEAVCREGAEMRHCIAGYARDAVQGRCYLFHVEKNNESASVQVSYEGRVVQAHGPNNRRNKAAEWGKRALARWGKKFPEITSINVPEPALAFDDGIPF